MWTPLPRALLAGGLLAWTLASGLSAQTLRDIRVEGALPHHPVVEVLTVRPGDALDPAQVRRSMQNLYRTGYISQVDVLQEPVGDGIRLIFRLTPYPVVRKVRLEGDVRPGPMYVLPGTPWTEPFQEIFVRDLETKLKNKGYLHPIVRASLDHGLLTARIAAGPHFRIAQVRFQVPEHSGKLDRLIEMEGRIFREEWVRARVAAMQKKLRKTYPEAALRYEGYEESGNVVNLVIAGEGLRPVVYDWPPGIERKTLRRFRKEFQAQGLRQEVLYQQAGTLEETLRNKGYPRASARFVLEQGPEADRIHGEFERGPRFALGTVGFRGLSSGMEEAVREVLRFEKQKWLSAERLDAWRDAVQAYLAERGRLDVQVDAPAVSYDEARGVADVSYTVKEGIQYVPEAVEVAGLPAGIPPPSLMVERSTPLAMSKIREDLQNIQALLSGQGYSQAQVTLRKEEKKLVYDVQPGLRFTVERHFFRNLYYTRTSALADEIPLKDGEPLSFARLLESQSRLYLTGLFASVDQETIHNWDRPEEVTVVAEVREDSPRSYAYGIGYDTYDRFRIQVGVSHANLFGTRRYLGVDARFSDKEKQWRMTYREPHFLGIPYPIHFTTYRSDEQRPDFSLKRWGTVVELVRTYGRLSRASLLYSYEIQVPFDVREGYPVPREESEKKVSSLGLAYINDERDDLLFPTRGAFFSAEVRYAFPILTASSRFFKAGMNWSLYLSPGRNTILAGSLRVGDIHNLKSGESIPLGERFFLGGRDTIRAYSRDMAGVEGQTIVDGQAVGGNLFVLANAELRQKLSGTFGFLLFVDAGQVWVEESGFELDQVTGGTGIGLFFLSPIGPLRAEYSWKWESIAWDDRSQWYLSLGFPF